MPQAEIGDGMLHYEIDGQGPALVLLPPQSRGPLGLADLQNSLARRHTVITYDQRGTGGSSSAPTTWSMAAEATDVIALLDALGVERASLLSHSTGCGIGISAAARCPDRVGALILASPWTHADEHLTTMQNLRMTLAHALAPKAYAQFNAALLYPPEYRRSHTDGFQRLAANAPTQPHDAADISRRLTAILDFDARPLLPQITAPTLVVTAKDDQLMPSWFAIEAADAISDAELVYLDGGGHMLLETRSTEITELVLRFLEQRESIY